MKEVTEFRFIREAECHRLTGIPRQSRWRLEKEGRFPKRIRTGERTHAWSEAEVLAWMHEKMRAARRDAPARAKPAR